MAFDEKDRKNILKYKAIGEENGVRGMEMIDKKRLNEIDPNAGGEFAMYVPSSGILDPMQYTIALAENACMNGAEFLFDHRVLEIERRDERYIIHTPAEDVSVRWVFNCAGMYASQISEMLGYPNYPVKGFKGEYYVLDKKAGKEMRIPIYPAPNDKGGFSTHATPTVDGNILVGPDSYVVEEAEDYKVTKEHMDGLFEDGRKVFKEMKREYFIRNFSGIRWKRYDPETGAILDFMLEADEKNPCTVNLVGIESPGITCALPLARRAVAKLVEKEHPAVNESFNPRRKGIRRFLDMSLEEKEQAVKENPDYGEVICRCETVTRAEILQAVHNPAGSLYSNRNQKPYPGYYGTVPGRLL